MIKNLMKKASAQVGRWLAREEIDALRERAEIAEGQLEAIDHINEGDWENGLAATWVHLIRNGVSPVGMITQDEYEEALPGNKDPLIIGSMHTFDSIYYDKEDAFMRNGQEVQILDIKTQGDYGPEYIIRFPDGFEYNAWDSELKN